jgi:NitT/TauT family transport system permease protein
MERAEQITARFQPISVWHQTPTGVRALTLLGGVIVWELIGRTGLFFPDIFPSFVAIVQALWEHVSTTVLLPHLWASFYAVGGGFLIGTALGVPLGVIFGSRRSVIAVSEPLILYLAVIPKIIIFPIFILFFGIGVQSKLAVGASAAFFPISLLTIAGMREVKPIYLSVARSVGATPFKIATQIYLPAVMAYVFAGLRIGMGAAVTGALLAETKVARAGLGFLAVDYYAQYRIAEMYSLFLLIFLMAALINWGMNAVLGRLSPHRKLVQDQGLSF